MREIHNELSPKSQKSFSLMPLILPLHFYQKRLEKFQALAFGKISASLQKLISLISVPTDSLFLPQSLAPAEKWMLQQEV